MGFGFKGKFDHILNICMNDLKSENIDRNAKLQIFYTIGDIVSAVQKYGLKHMDVILEAMDLGF